VSHEGIQIKNSGLHRRLHRRIPGGSSGKTQPTKVHHPDRRTGRDRENQLHDSDVLPERQPCSFAAYKKHIGFYPTSTGIAAFQEHLKAYKTSKGTVQFPMDEPIPETLIKAIVEFRVAENSL